jgi:hypothetical protein
VLSDGISGCGPGKFKTAVMNIVGYIARFTSVPVATCDMTTGYIAA